MEEEGFILTLTNADGELTRNEFLDHGTSKIQVCRDRFVGHLHHEESQTVVRKQIAILHVTGLRVVLETSGRVAIRPPTHTNSTTDAFEDDTCIVLPPGNLPEDAHCFVHLRPGDIVYFQTPSLQLQYDLLSAYKTPEAKMPPTIHEDQVQVKSSDPKMSDHDVRMEPVDDSETDEDTEVGQTTPERGTSATSRPEVKETPRHRNASEEKLPYSTAPEPPADSASQGECEDEDEGGSKARTSKLSSEIGDDTDIVQETVAAAGSSPVIQAADRAKQGKAGTLRVISIDQTDFDNDGDFPSGSNKMSRSNGPVTYTARSKHSKNNSAKIRNNVTDDTEEPPNPTTSDALFPEGVPTEVAKRSLSNKRAREPSDEDEADEDEDEVIAKVRKISAGANNVAKPAGPEREGNEGDAEAEDDTDDGGPSQILAGSRVSSGRLPQIPRMSEDTPDDADDDEVEDEIAVSVKPKAKSGRKTKTKKAASKKAAPKKAAPKKMAASEPSPEVEDDPQDADDNEDGNEVHMTAKLKVKAGRKGNLSPEVVVRPQRLSKSASRTSLDPTGTPQSTSASSISGKAPKVLFSTYSPTAGDMRFLKAHGSGKLDSVLTKRTHFLCVVKDNKKLAKTPKVLRSLVLGKRVVTTQWLDACKGAGELLDPSEFVHEEVADTADLDRSKLFFGNVLYFTDKTVSEYGSDNWMEMKELATEAGASSVDSGTGGKGGAMTGRNIVVYIGTHDDPDVTTLIEVHGRVVYHKDLIRDAVVTGKIDLEDDQYRLKAETKKKTGRRR